MAKVKMRTNSVSRGEYIFMKRTLNLILISLVFLTLAVGLWGCRDTSAATVALAEATEIAPTPTETPDEPTATPMEAMEAAPQETIAVVEEVTLDPCSECHTDQQALIDTAKPEETLISENEGQG
jgi:hypothetical protein